MTWKTVYIAQGIVVDGDDNGDDDDDEEDYELEEGYYVDWSEGSSASSVTSEGPYHG